MRTRERDHVRIMRTRERYLAKMLAKCSTSHFFRPRKVSARRSDGSARGGTDGASWIRAGCAVGWSRSRYRANPVTQIATLSSKSCHTNCYQICSISSIEQICSISRCRAPTRPSPSVVRIFSEKCELRNLRDIGSSHYSENNAN